MHFDGDISEDMILKFRENFGPDLVYISIDGLNAKFMRKLLNFCHNLKALLLRKGKLFLDEDKEFLPELESISCSIDAEEGEDLKIIADKYGNKLKKIPFTIEKKIINLCSERYPEFIPLKNINEFMLHLNGLALKCKNLSTGLEELAEKLVE